MTLESKRKDTIVIHHQGESGYGLHAMGNQQHLNALHYVQNKHMKGEGGDIGYNFVIDPHGNIYEGRDLKYEAAHVSGQNPGKIGILMLGYYENVGITRRAEDSLCDLLGHLIDSYELDWKSQHIKGHQQVNDTNCPGTELFRSIPDIIKKCKERCKG